MTSKNSNVVITSMGALTPVGSTAEKSCAAIRAGITRISEHAYYECTPHDPEWDEDLPLFSSSVPAIDPFLDGFDRCLFRLDFFRCNLLKCQRLNDNRLIHATDTGKKWTINKP